MNEFGMKDIFFRNEVSVKLNWFTATHGTFAFISDMASQARTSLVRK